MGDTTKTMDWSQSSDAYKAVAEKITKHMAERALIHFSDLWTVPTGNGGVVNFLDVAAGPGFFSGLLAEKLKNSGSPYSILCTDFSEGMLEQARKDISDPHVKFLQMDGQQMSNIADKSMDGLNCLFGIMFMPQYGECLREMSRVLKPGGKATVGTWQKTGTHSLAEAFGRFLGTLGEGEVSEMRTTFAVGADPEVLASYMREGGFSHVIVLEEQKVVTIENPELVFQAFMSLPTMANIFKTGRAEAKAPSLELWNEFVESSPLASPFKKDGVLTWERICNMAVAAV